MENLNIGDLVEIKTGPHAGRILPIINLAYVEGVVFAMFQPEDRIVSVLETQVEKHRHHFENGRCRCGAVMGYPQ